MAAARTRRRLAVWAFLALLVGCIPKDDDDSTSDDDSGDDDDATVDDDDSTSGNDDDFMDDDDSSPSKGWTALTTTNSYTCGVRPSGQADCWGSLEFSLPGPFEQLRGGASCVFGTLVSGNAQGHCLQDANGPLPGGEPYRFAAGGGGIACAIGAAGNQYVDEGAIACWSGDEGAEFTNLPEGDFVSLHLGWSAGCAISSDQELLCWGGTTPPPMPAVDVVGSISWCARGPDGIVSCWACGLDFGQCEVPDSSWSDVSAHSFHACGVTTDGGLVCWGCGGPDDPDYVDSGQCDAPSGTDWVDVSVGQDHSCALNKAGEIHCWGCEGDTDRGQCDVPP